MKMMLWRTFRVALKTNITDQVAAVRDRMPQGPRTAGVELMMVLQGKSSERLITRVAATAMHKRWMDAI